MGRKQKSSPGILSSFISSVNRTGNENTFLTIFIFITGGLFAFYMGYSDGNTLLTLGGAVTLLIGLLIMYRTYHMLKKKRR